MIVAPRISLRWIVPALMAAFLTVVLTVFGAIAYRDVRVSTLRTTTERLRTAVQAIARPAPPALWQRTAMATAANPAVSAIARSSGSRVTDSARELIRRLLPDTGQTLAAEVRSPTGDLLFSVSRKEPDNAMPSAPARAVDRPRSRAVGDRPGAKGTPFADSLRLGSRFPDTVASSRLYARGDRILYERAVPIRDSGQLVGHLVEVQALSASPVALRTVANLIGPGAAFIVGNTDGSLWTDLAKRIEHPPSSDSVYRYSRDGRVWLGAGARVPTGPFFVGIEEPEDTVLSPVHVLFWRFLGMGVVVLALGTMAAERLSRRLTRPLTELTTAAEGIASGDRTASGAPLSRPDEIGRLSRAFAVMADSVHVSQKTLEDQIQARTAQLQDAVTQLRETQDELLRKERLATLGQLSSSIGHELRNPLGVMTNALYYLELVLRDAPPKVKDHIAMLQSQVRLSEAIISGLLDYARSAAPKRVVVSATLLIDDTLKRVPLPASVRVERHIAPDAPDLRVDPMQVGQILVNLFSNAWQAMAEGGILSITVRSAAERVQFDVADDGPGVASENLGKIFEPLFTTRARGIGLGLAIARSLARANQGELTVANRPHGGAVFTLLLPAAEPSAAEGTAGGTGGVERAAVETASS